jgi:hypothetical protein
MSDFCKERLGHFQDEDCKKHFESREVSNNIRLHMISPWTYFDTVIALTCRFPSDWTDAISGSFITSLHLSHRIECHWLLTTLLSFDVDSLCENQNPSSTTTPEGWKKITPFTVYPPSSPSHLHTPDWGRRGIAAQIFKIEASLLKLWHQAIHLYFVS